MKSSLVCGIVAVASSRTRVWCIYCGAFIPKAAKCIEQHTNGARHKESIELMNENGLSFMNDALHCKPCNRSLSHEESVIKHIDGEEHSNWKAAMDDLVDGEFITLDGYLSCEKDYVYCDVCNSNIDSSLPSIEEHVNNPSHRKNVTNRLKPINAIFPVDNEDLMWCKVCQVFMDDTIQSILDHIDDDEQHMEWFTEMEDLIQDQEISLDSFLSVEDEMHAYCKKCHEEILCTIHDVQNHVLSEAHMNRIRL